MGSKIKTKLSLDAKYSSPYGADRKITAAQYICETMCGRRAKAMGVELPNKFWEKSKNNTEWNTYFIRQTRYAVNLIKQYGEATAMAAVRANPCIYSLANDQFEDFCQLNSEKYNAKQQKTELINVTSNPSKRFTTKNKLSSL